MNSYFWAGPLLAPIFVIGVVKLSAYICRKIPEGKLKRLLTHELWKADSPNPR